MEQAVILAGGLGERLRPLTDNIPKPLVPIEDKPFIKYVIEDLRSKGISKFLLLTGYRSDLISQYFEADNTILCLATPQNFSKSERLLHANLHINEEFLLLYGDNLIPENLEIFKPNNSDIQFTITRKNPGNVELTQKSINVRYFPERSTELDYIELGYIGVKKTPLFETLRKVQSLEEAFCVVASNNRATARVIQGPYFSISDLSRFQISKNAIKGKKIILIDRDGVINTRMPIGEYVTEVDKFEFIEENIIGMQDLTKKGFTFVIVSNQAGIARGHMSESQLNKVNNFMIKRLSEFGITILDLFTCMHGWEEDCLCRKPRPGLLLEAARKYNLFLKKTVFIGDDKRDVEAALAANCNPIFIGIKEDLGSLQNNVKSNVNVSLAMDDIINVYERNN